MVYSGNILARAAQLTTGSRSRLSSDRWENDMTNQSTHFSISRLIHRPWALGLQTKKSQAESADRGLAARLKLAVYIDIENFSNDGAIRSIFESLAPR